MLLSTARHHGHDMRRTEARCHQQQLEAFQAAKRSHDVSVGLLAIIVCGRDAGESCTRSSLPVVACRAMAESPQTCLHTELVWATFYVAAASCHYGA